MKRATRNPALRALVLAGAMTLAACVTEEPRRRVPAPAPDGAATGKYSLPDGPIATPAGRRTTTRLNCRVLPLGTVAYDGQVLPLLSPDGLFMAVEQGDAPTWPTLLAQPDATPTPGTRVAAFDLRSVPMREISPAEPPPRGVILGRSCDSRGYLVEWPRPDGSRWIGRIAWLTGAVEWLAQGAEVNAHGVLAADGTLAYTRRANSADALASLVVRHADGSLATFTPDSGACAFPVFAPGGGVVCTLVLSPAGLELVALRGRLADGTPVRNLGPPLARRTLTTSADLTLAYQAMAGASATVPEFDVPETAAREAVLFFHPGASRMAAFWWRDGSILTLAPRSIAAAHSPLIDPPGFFQTTPEGLVFSPMPEDLNEGVAAPRIMEASHVPRATSNAERPIILIGPAGRRDPTRLTVIAMSVLTPDASE